MESDKLKYAVKVWFMIGKVFSFIETRIAHKISEEQRHYD
jgi:hypothetical protein